MAISSEGRSVLQASFANAGAVEPRLPSVRMRPEPPLFLEALPTLGAALQRSLLDEDEPHLAASLSTARVYALCECGEPACMSFYLSPPIEGPCPGEYRVVIPAAVMTLGVCDEQIDWVQDEVLGRTDEETLRRRSEYESLGRVVPRFAPSN